MAAIPAGAFSLLVCLAALPQESPPQPASSYRLQVLVDRVLVDVVVRDKGGQPVQGLKQEDFRLYEDGVKQTILSFSEEEVATSGVAAPPPGAAAPPAPGGTTPVNPARRLIALYFGPMRPEDRTLALRSAREFLESKVTPADYVAVLAGASLVQNFTNNQERLRAALDAVEKREVAGRPHPQPAEPLPPSGGQPTPASEEGASGSAASASPPPVGGAAATQNAVPVLGAVPADMQAEFQRMIQDVSGLEPEFFLSSVLRDLQGIVHALRYFPGRKSLVVYSSGIPVSRENKVFLDRAIDDANRANVVVYVVNARGLEGLGGTYAASETQKNEFTILRTSTVAQMATGAKAQQDYAALLERRSGLDALARQTGGRSYETNDLGAVFPDVQQDTQSYYLLSYKPKSSVRDGKFHSLKVEVRGRSDLRVLARPGYYAPKDFADFTDSDKRLYLTQALLSDQAFTDVPLGVELAQFLLPDGRYFVSVTYSLPVTRVPRRTRGNKAEVQLNFFGQAAPVGGRGGYALRDQASFKVDEAQFAEGTAREPALEYLSEMVLPAGVYRTKFVVQDEFSGQVGSVRGELRLTGPAENELATSSLVLTDRLLTLDPKAEEAARRQAEKARENNPAAEPPVGNPLVVGTQKVLPRLVRQFRAEQPAFLYLQVYDLPPHPRTGRPLASCRLTVLLHQGKAVRPLGVLMVNQYADPGRRLAAVPGTVNLQGLAPGAYELEVVVNDEVGNRKRTLHQSFEIVQSKK